MTPVSFDFRKPPPGELERQVGGWLTLALRRANAAWARLIPYPSELKLGTIEGRTVSAVRATFGDSTIGVPLRTPDAADGLLLLALERPLLLALLAGLMGEIPSALPADRELTDLETSLLDYLVRELFLNPFEKGWSGTDPLQLTSDAPGSPRAVWRVSGGEGILHATVSASTALGEYPIHLTVPRVGRWERMTNSEPRANPIVPGAREQIEKLVQEMTVDLAVILGTADLTMGELARLKAGDVVVLRQKVHQPLEGLVAGCRKFRVWPGELGGRAAIQIEAPAED